MHHCAWHSCWSEETSVVTGWEQSYESSDPPNIRHLECQASFLLFEVLFINVCVGTKLCPLVLLRRPKPFCISHNCAYMHKEHKNSWCVHSHWQSLCTRSTSLNCAIKTKLWVADLFWLKKVTVKKELRNNFIMFVWRLLTDWSPSDLIRSVAMKQIKSALLCLSLVLFIRLFILYYEHWVQ